MDRLLEELRRGWPAVIRHTPVLVAVVGAAIAAILVYHALVDDPGGSTWTAEFTNARGLVTGNDVRVDGAVVGRVTSISLSRRGQALVRFRLSARRAAPRPDAAAAIEPADLLGDTYLSLSPGAARGALRGPITPADTVNAPRLDQVLDSLSPDVRDGLRVLLVEAGLALDQRGADLSRTAVALRGALQAAGGVLGELDTQDGSLARLVPVAQRAAAQLDSRRSEFGPLLDGLSRTLNATAASPLDRGLSGLPATLAALRSTASNLATTAIAATPLVQRLEPAAIPLGEVVAGMPALVERVRDVAPSLRSVLSAARRALVAGAPGLSRLAAAFPVLRGQAPSISTLLGELDAAAPGIAQGFLVDFPDQAAESGTQPFDPFGDPKRAYWRGAAVFSCEAFGVPVAPGCLTRALSNLVHQPAPSSSLRTTSGLLHFLLSR